jgi:hypothetical protein
VKKIIFFLGIVVTYTSCKKEEDSGCTPMCGTVTAHYAYVMGSVIDSLTGNPEPQVIIYPTSDYSSRVAVYNQFLDTADANGIYTATIRWYSGNFYGGSYQDGKPADSADIYIDAVGLNSSGLIKIKGYQLIENDTVPIAVLYVIPCGYIGTHIKDTLLSSYGIGVNWQFASGPTTFQYDDYYPADTMIFHKTIRGLAGKISWGTYSQTVIVNSADTAFVDVFY